MHTGDSVSFRCNVNISSGWKFLWFKDGDKFEKDDHHNISSAQVKDTGIYTCQAERDSFRLQKSQNMQIEVKGAVFHYPLHPLLLEVCHR